MSKKVIVTGVSGQAGSYFAEYLLENTDYEIYGMVRRLSVQNHINIEHFKSNPRFHLFSGDLNDAHSLSESIEKIQPDYYINCAAQSFVAESWVTPANTMLVDSVAIIHILEAIRKIKPSCRFITFGSSEEMGDVQYSPQDEKHPARARSVYGAAKIASRQIVKVYRESYNLYAVQPWLYNYESPRRGFEFISRKITQGIARIYYSIKNNIDFKPIELGNLDSMRDWSFCKDIVDGVWRMVNQDKFRTDWKNRQDIDLSKEIKEYIFSSNETHSINSLIELAFNYSGIHDLCVKKHGEGCFHWYGDTNKYGLTEKDPNRSYYWSKMGEMGEQFNYRLIEVNPKFFRPADVVALHGNSNLARQELGWKPQYSFQDLIEEMVQADIERYSRK